MQGLNVMIVGVGGQGTLVASKILGNVAMRKLFDVKVAEVHGMAQRGGSVVTCVKFGYKVYSPIIDKGNADIVLAFEQLEALRWAGFLRKDGILIFNEEIIEPLPVLLGREVYPENISGLLKEKYKNVFSLNATELAEKSGSIKSANIVLLGFAAGIANLAKDANDEIWIGEIKNYFRGKLADKNISAFKEGYRKGIEIVENCLN